VILSSALFHNYLPLLVVATYVLAPVPNWICSKASSGQDDYLDGGSSGGGVLELGKFITGFMVVMGIGTSIKCNRKALRDERQAKLGEGGELHEIELSS
jgi:hypothetical protein